MFATRQDNRLATAQSAQTDPRGTWIRKLDLTGLVRNFLFAPLVDLSCAVDRAILLVRWRASVVPLVFPEDGSSHPQLHDFSVVWLVAAWQLSPSQIASPIISQFVSNWFRCRCYVGIPMMALAPHRAMTTPTHDMTRMVTTRALMTPPRASTGVRSRCMAPSTVHFLSGGSCMAKYASRAAVVIAHWSSAA
jgi:hypothetical protein